MSPKFRPPTLVWAALIAALGAASWIGLQRHKVEASHRAVHLAAGFEDIRLVAVSSRSTISETLSALKSAGLTAVVVSEETFEDVLTSGRLTPIVGSPPKLFCNDDELGERLARISAERFSQERAATVIVLKSGKTINFPLAYRELKPFGVGFDQAICDAVDDAGLTLIGRVGNPPSSSRDMLNRVVADLVATGAKGVIFQGDQVLGFRDQVEEVANLLSVSRAWYGSVEFGNQAGDARMVSELIRSSNVPPVLRVHSVLPGEMNQHAVPTIVDRYVRAAAERGIRVLYLRPASAAAEDASLGFRKLVNAVSDGVRREGYAPKEPGLLERLEIPSFALLAVSAGGLILCVWFAAALFRRPAVTAAAVLLAVALFGLSATGSVIAVKSIALLIALVFPTWAICAGFDSQENSPNPWCAYLWISLLSLVGGLLCAALLTNLSFMLRADQFSGVKLAHLLPPIAAGLYLLFSRSKVRESLASPVRWLDAAILLGVGAALLVVLIRTGNEAPSAVTNLELQLRDVMDRLLPERPRTKELFVGHPALLLGLLLASSGRWRWVPLFALAAAIGQASIVNTLCHLHTPILTSVIRVGTGFLAGGILGLVAWFILRAVRKGSSPSPE